MTWDVDNYMHMNGSSQVAALSNRCLAKLTALEQNWSSIWLHLKNNVHRNYNLHADAKFCNVFCWLYRFSRCLRPVPDRGRKSPFPESGPSFACGAHTGRRWRCRRRHARQKPHINICGRRRKLEAISHDARTQSFFSFFFSSFSRSEERRVGKECRL